MEKINFRDYNTFCKFFNNRLTLREAVELSFKLKCFLVVRELGASREDMRGKELHHLVSKSSLKNRLGISKELADKYASLLQFNEVHADDLEHSACHYLQAIINKSLGKNYDDDANAVNAVLGASIFNRKTLGITTSKPTFTALLGKLDSTKKFSAAVEEDKLNRESGLVITNIISDGTTKDYTVKEARENNILSDLYITELLRNGTLGRAEGVGKFGGVWIVKEKMELGDECRLLEETAVDITATIPAESVVTAEIKTEESIDKRKGEYYSIQVLTNYLEKKGARRLIINTATGEFVIVTSKDAAIRAISSWIPEYKNVDNIDKGMSYSFRKKTKECKRGMNGKLNLVDGKKVFSFLTYFVAEDFPERFGHMSKKTTKRRFSSAIATVPPEYASLVR